MRPPILGLTVAFGAGLITALSGVELRVTACLVLLGAAALYRRAPLGAALGVMLVAGVLWGSAARQEQAASCNGRWAHQSEEHTSELQSLAYLVCRLLLEKKKNEVYNVTRTLTPR